MSHENLNPETIAISMGRPERNAGEGLNVPITLNSTYVANGAINYGRTGNQTWEPLEEAISALEEASSTLIFSSGMAAITAAFSILPHGAPVVASDEGYSGTMSLLKRYHSEGRLEVRFVDITDTKEVIAQLQGAAFLWVESPTNPGLGVAEVSVIIGEAKKRNLGVGFDNTFATPLNQKPLTFGADIVMHSVTKYLAGHSDVLLGSLSMKDPALHARLQNARMSFGSIAGPFESWLALRGIRTFPLRFERAQENAAILATRLATHQSVSDVRYPGFGAIISFQIDGDAKRAEVICDAATLITNATSLGGVETTWERRRRWELESHSVPENLIRLSVGCEHVEDLWRDIQSALAER
ncbi:MAG: PLP-dependent transferase [Actinobacteria bacterium]|nr:PLP-dependent transferase [Actinomycetota bacterium]